MLTPEDLGERQYYVASHSHFQPKEMPKISVENPSPGSWFAVAFITDDEDVAITQQVSLVLMTVQRMASKFMFYSFLLFHLMLGNIACMPLQSRLDGLMGTRNGCSFDNARNTRSH